VNSIDWQPKALRQLRKIDARAGKQIRDAVSTELVDLGKARNVKALTNHDYGYRLRVGNYRVFFDYDGAVRIVSIEEVRKRDERTY
jgi:mRNA interferase RelE/StbE